MERKRITGIVSGLLAVAVLATACQPIQAVPSVRTVPPPVEMYTFQGNQNSVPVYGPGISNAPFNPSCDSVKGKKPEHWGNVQSVCETVDTLIDIFHPSPETEQMLRELPSRSYFLDSFEVVRMCRGSVSACVIPFVGPNPPLVFIDKTLNNIGVLEPTTAHEYEHGVEEQGRTTNFTYPFADGSCMVMRDETLYSISPQGDKTVISPEINASWAGAIYSLGTTGSIHSFNIGYLRNQDPSVQNAFIDFATYAFNTRETIPGINTIIEPLSSADALQAFFEYVGTVSQGLNFYEPTLSLAENGARTYKLFNGFFPKVEPPYVQGVQPSCTP